MTKTNILSVILLFFCDLLRGEQITTVFIDKSHDVSLISPYLNVTGDITISGKIVAENGFAVSNAQLTLKQGNTILATTTTTTLGTYAFLNLDANQTYTIEVSKNTDVYIGITTFDMNLITRSILGEVPFSSNYKLMAANVSENDTDNSTVDVLDVLLIRRTILRVDPSLPINTWSFIPSGYQFTTVAPNFPKPQPTRRAFTITTASASIEFNFVGIKEGDVNGTAR